MEPRDFDSLRLQIPWSYALVHSIIPATIFGMIPGDGLVPFLAFFAFAWTICAIGVHAVRPCGTGRDGLTVGSVKLPWAEIHDPAVDKKRLRVADSKGTYFHLPEWAWQDARFRTSIEKYAPSEHSLVRFLRTSEYSEKSALKAPRAPN